MLEVGIKAPDFELPDQNGKIHRLSDYTGKKAVSYTHLAIALRAVNTIDFMTAEAAEIPWEVLGKVSSRIVNEVKHVNRVLYDCTGKPPATIEFE